MWSQDNSAPRSIFIVEDETFESVLRCFTFSPFLDKPVNKEYKQNVNQKISTECQYGHLIFKVQLPHNRYSTLIDPVGKWKAGLR